MTSPIDTSLASGFARASQKYWASIDEIEKKYCYGPKSGLVVDLDTMQVSYLSAQLLNRNCCSWYLMMMKWSTMWHRRRRAPVSKMFTIISIMIRVCRRIRASGAIGSTKERRQRMRQPNRATLAAVLID